MFYPITAKEAVIVSLNGRNAGEVAFFEPGFLLEGKLRAASREISTIFGKAFFNTTSPDKLWDPESVMRNLLDSSLAALITINREVVGYAIFECIPFRGGQILFVDAVACTRQGNGIGGTTIQEAVRLTASQIIAARTQNPAIIKMLRN